MTSPALPHLFGRFTALMRGHADIGPTLLRARRMCAVLEGADAVLPDELMPLTVFRQLYGELADHFSLEEADEYFGVVVQEAPQLTSRIEELKAEHGAMLRTLHTLSGLARQRERWRELPQSTTALLQLLEAHERAESALLRAMFLDQSR